MSNVNIIKTEITASRTELLELFDMETLESLMNARGAIQVCEGEWRYDGDARTWRFYKFEEI